MPVATQEVTESRATASSRLKREGRYDELMRRKDAIVAELRKQGQTKKESNLNAWPLALKEFPPEPLPELKPDPAPEKLEPVAPKWQPPRPPNVEAAFAALPASKDGSIRQDYMWVHNHAAMWRAADEGKVYLRDSDIEGCPSRGAWNLLNQAIADREKFQASMSAKFLRASNDGEPENSNPEFVDDDLGDLEAMLADVIAADRCEFLAKVWANAEATVLAESNAVVQRWLRESGVVLAANHASQLGLYIADAISRFMEVKPSTTAPDLAPAKTSSKPSSPAKGAIASIYLE